MLKPMPVAITAIPCLVDNYAYLLVDEEARQAVVVDPSDAPPVQHALDRRGLALTAMWCTHHHFDHVGGVSALRRRWPEADVVGSVYDQAHGRIEGQTRAVGQGDALEFGGERFEVLHVPGHTLGAVAFAGAGAVLTGDTLFLGGCGRLFEGTAAQLRASLEALASLPPETRVLCGHEYTVKNLEFAVSVEPGNRALAERLAACRALRERGAPTVPGTIGEERETNPFLRTSAPALVAWAHVHGAQGDSADEVFAALRAAKDRF
jgi:hydroxyacylglutathione hydrolase